MTSIVLALCAVHLVAVASPGPGFFVQVRNTLSGGFGVGFLSAFGIAMGDLVLLMISILGASAVITSHPESMRWIQAFGAAYITFLGFQAIRSFFRGFKKKSINSAETIPVVTQVTYLEGFKTGFITTVLNPKAIVYFVSLSSQFIKPTHSLATNFSLGGLMILITFLWFSTVCVLIGNPIVRKKMMTHQYVLDGVMGFILVLFGIYALMYLI